MRRRGRGILALEEPETFLFPHAQRRVIDECVELADQTFITTHSPYVLERIPAEGIGRLAREPEGVLNWKPLDTSNVRHLNLYSKRIRQTFCEALLGRGVLIVEGDSDRWWIYGTSRIVNRQAWQGRSQQALELQGICVVAAEANSDLVKLGRFFCEAGIHVVCLADRVKDSNVVDELCAAPFCAMFQQYGGLERLLAAELPMDIVRTTLNSSEHSKVPLPDSHVVGTATDDEARGMFRDLLIGNKGSAAFHEWIISQLDEPKLPKTLKNIVDLASALVADKTNCCKLSLI